MPSIYQFIVWIIVGLIAGGLVGRVVTAEGYGLLRNLALGLAGALVGGLLFHLFGILPAGLDKIAVSLRDIVSAVVGAFIVLAVLWVWRRATARSA